MCAHTPIRGLSRTLERTPCSLRMMSQMASTSFASSLNEFSPDAGCHAPVENGHLLMTQPARDRSNKLVTPCGNLQSPKIKQTHSRLDASNQTRRLDQFYRDDRSTLNIIVPSTGDPGKHVWVTACHASEQFCRQEGYIGVSRDGLSSAYSTSR